MATVILPDSLVRLFPGAARRVECDAHDVGGVVDELERRWPGMRDRLCVPAQDIRRHITMWVDGERATLETPVDTRSEVLVLLAMSGG
jgi:hypothetical protein